MVTTSTTRSFHHFTVGGELEVEESEVLAETVDSVTCRWCGHGRSVEVVANDDEMGSDEPPVETGA